MGTFYYSVAAHMQGGGKMIPFRAYDCAAFRAHVFLTGYYYLGNDHCDNGNYYGEHYCVRPQPPRKHYLFHNSSCICVWLSP